MAFTYSRQWKIVLFLGILWTCLPSGHCANGRNSSSSTTPKKEAELPNKSGWSSFWSGIAGKIVGPLISLILTGCILKQCLKYYKTFKLVRKLKKKYKSTYDDVEMGWCYKECDYCSPWWILRIWCASYCYLCCCPNGCPCCKSGCCNRAEEDSRGERITMLDQNIAIGVDRESTGVNRESTFSKSEDLQFVVEQANESNLEELYSKLLQKLPTVEEKVFTDMCNKYCHGHYYHSTYCHRQQCAQKGHKKFGKCKGSCVQPIKYHLIFEWEEYVTNVDVVSKDLLKNTSRMNERPNCGDMLNFLLKNKSEEIKKQYKVMEDEQKSISLVLVDFPAASEAMRFKDAVWYLLDFARLLEISLGAKYHRTVTNGPSEDVDVSSLTGASTTPSTNNNDRIANEEEGTANHLPNTLTSTRELSTISPTTNELSRTANIEEHIDVSLPTVSLTIPPTNSVAAPNEVAMDVQRVTLEETGNQLPINTSTSTDAPSTLQVTANEVSGNVNGQDFENEPVNPDERDSSNYNSAQSADEEESITTPVANDFDVQDVEAGFLGSALTPLTDSFTVDDVGGGHFTHYAVTPVPGRFTHPTAFSNEEESLFNPVRNNLDNQYREMPPTNYPESEQSVVNDDLNYPRVASDTTGDDGLVDREIKRMKQLPLEDLPGKFEIRKALNRGPVDIWIRSFPYTFTNDDDEEETFDLDTSDLITISDAVYGGGNAAHTFFALFQTRKYGEPISYLRNILLKAREEFLQAIQVLSKEEYLGDDKIIGNITSADLFELAKHTSGVAANGLQIPQKTWEYIADESDFKGEIIENIKQTRLRLGVEGKSEQLFKIIEMRCPEYKIQDMLNVFVKEKAIVKLINKKIRQKAERNTSV